MSVMDIASLTFHAESPRHADPAARKVRALVAVSSAVHGSSRGLCHFSQGTILVTVLAGVWAKISQAKDHLDNLERQAQAFWDSEPYKIRAERNPDTGAINCRGEGAR